MNRAERIRVDTSIAHKENVNIAQKEEKHRKVLPYVSFKAKKRLQYLRYTRRPLAVPLFSPSPMMPGSKNRRVDFLFFIKVVIVIMP